MNSGIHRWNVIGEVATISPGGDTTFFSSMNDFNISIVADNGNSIITSLSLITFAGLNDSRISCRDAIRGVEVQNTTVMLFGKLYYIQ